MNAAVEVEGVTKRFAGTLALNDVSFSVKQGDVLALPGPNGDPVGDRARGPVRHR